MTHVEDGSTIPQKTRRSYGKNACSYSVEGLTCGKKHFAKGLCQAHYMRKRRTGKCGGLFVAPTRPRHLEDYQVVMAKVKVRKREWTLKDAADHFGCSYYTIVDAVNGRTFRHLRNAGYPEG